MPPRLDNAARNHHPRGPSGAARGCEALLRPENHRVFRMILAHYWLWAYQSGCRRIGAVDLFACEISVICRVSLIVDFAKTSVARALQAREPVVKLDCRRLD